MQPCMFLSENLSVCTEVCRHCKYSHNGKSFSHLLPQPTFECLIFVSYILNKRSLASTDDGLVLEVTQPCNDSKQKKNCWFNFLGENLFLDGCATVSIKSYTGQYLYTGGSRHKYVNFISANFVTVIFQNIP